MDETKKTGRYERIYNQLNGLLEPNTNSIAAMATIIAVLHQKFDYYFWTGFYMLTEDSELVVGPYQGPLACIKLKKNTGVCWASINREETVVVPNVHDFPGHIACDSRSQSEIVVPLKDCAGNIKGVMDVDSTSLNSFSEIDKEGLENILRLINHHI